MAKQNPIDIKTASSLEENSRTQQQKNEASAIEAKQAEAARKAEAAKKAYEAELARKEEARKKKEEAKKEKEQKEKEAQAALGKQKEELLQSGLALADTAMKNRGQNGGFLKGLLLGILIGAVGVFLLLPKADTPAMPETLPPAEEADVAIADNGIPGYTAADFQEAVLGGASEHQELIVMEQPLSISTTITRAGLGNLPIFSKMQDLTYYGTGVYTADLSHLDADHIQVDENTCTVTIRIPHAVLQYVNPELSKTEFEDTEHGLLAFGDIRLSAEETSRLEQSVYDAMRQRLDSKDLYEEADRFAKLKTWEIFQPSVSAVSPLFKVEMEFEN